MLNKFITTVSTLALAASLSAVAVGGSATASDLAFAGVAVASAFSLAGAFVFLGIAGLLHAARDSRA